MTRDEIFTKVRDILMDELAVDEDEVSPDSSLVKDLGAESIDFLAIVLAHEIGHFSGLFHTSEGDGTSSEPLPDTERCELDLSLIHI